MFTLFLAALSVFLVSGLGCDSQSEASAGDATRLDQLEKRLAVVENKLAAVQLRVASVERRPAATVTKTTPTPATPSAAPVTTPSPVTPAAKPNAVAATGGPSITVEQPEHDFGPTWVGKDLHHTFTVRNTGDSPLQITRVHTPCSCSKAGAHPNSLAPGESGEFPFTLKTEKLRGKYSRKIQIFTNDPRNPQTTLFLKGECKRYVELSNAGRAMFQTITDNEPKERTIKITNNWDQPLELTLEPPQSEDFAFVLSETKPGQEFELRVRTMPPHKPGMINASAVLKTNVPAEPTLKIPAVARIPERLDVSPSRILLRPTPGANGVIKRTVRMMNYGETPVQLTGAEVNDPSLTATIRPVQDGRTYSVEIAIPADFTKSKQNKILTLSTNDPEKPSLMVPIISYGQRTPGTANATRKRTRPAATLIGKAAPGFNTTTVAGKPVGGESMNGKVTVLNFFAANCGFCKKQMPRLDAMRAAYEAKGVRFLNVSQTMRNRRYTDDQIKQVVQGIGVSGELVTDPDNAVGREFKVSSYPTMVIVGKTGKVETVNFGNKRDLETRVPAQLDALLAGKPVPSFPM